MKSIKLPPRFGIRFIFYFAGLFIMTLGISISVKSNLGVSPVSSIPYTLTCICGIEMGKATILLHCTLVLLQIILLRKNFKWINLLQVLIGIVFGYFTTWCNMLMNTIFPGAITNYFIRGIMILISIVLIALGIFFYMPAKLIPLAGEGFTLALSQVTGLPVHKSKIVMDVSMVALSLICCLIFLHNLGSVGIGTVVAAFLVGFCLGLFNKAFGKQRDRLYGYNSEKSEEKKDENVQ